MVYKQPIKIIMLRRFENSKATLSQAKGFPCLKSSDGRRVRLAVLSSIRSQLDAIIPTVLSSRLGLDWRHGAPLGAATEI